MVRENVTVTCSKLQSAHLGMGSTFDNLYVRGLLTPARIGTAVSPRFHPKVRAGLMSLMELLVHKWFDNMFNGCERELRPADYGSGSSRRQIILQPGGCDKS